MDVLKRQQQTKTLCCKNPRRVQVATPPGPTSTILVSVWLTTLHIWDAQIWKQTTATSTSLPMQHSQIIPLWHYTDECHYYQIQVLTALLMKNQVYCDVMPCWLLKQLTQHNIQENLHLQCHYSVFITHCTPVMANIWCCACHSQTLILWLQN
jgi:hypothetical protein